MDSSVPTAQELGGYFLATQHSLTRRWVDDAFRLNLLVERCAEDVLMATDLEFAASRARRFAPGPLFVRLR
ncbi:hypothetical protein [Actinopolymorpha alba]|uniref:hypothetical protein n=1 Tax=Actinopolymorpha alba TaxID=533267 RepID=UPI00037E1CA1|nr:hypothetical protein [Actinopolymorpha alba]